MPCSPGIYPSPPPSREASGSIWTRRAAGGSSRPPCAASCAPIRGCRRSTRSCSPKRRSSQPASTASIPASWRRRCSRSPPTIRTRSRVRARSVSGSSWSAPPTSGASIRSIPTHRSMRRRASWRATSSATAHAIPRRIRTRSRSRRTTRARAPSTRTGASRPIPRRSRTSPTSPSAGRGRAPTTASRLGRWCPPRRARPNSRGKRRAPGRGTRRYGRSRPPR